MEEDEDKVVRAEWLTVETKGIEEEATEILEADSEMNVEEEGKREEGGDENPRALE